MSAQLIEFSFPESSFESAEAWIAEALKLPDVLDGDVIRRANVGVAEVKAWLDVAGVALPLLTGAIALLQSRGLKNVTLRINDVVLTADRASGDQIAKIIQAANKK